MRGFQLIHLNPCNWGGCFQKLIIVQESHSNSEKLVKTNKRYFGVTTTKQMIRKAGGTLANEQNVSL